MIFDDNENGTFTVVEGKMFYWKEWSAYVPPGTITNFPTLGLARLFFNPLDYTDESTLHDALVGEYGDPVKIFNIHTNESREATWEEAGKWFKHELNKDHNRLISQLFYGAVMLWKRFR